MARKSKKPTLKLVVDHPPAPKQRDMIIAIMPLEQGVFAWIVEEAPYKPLPF